MKKVLGITLMAALLGLNAYIWPALYKSVSASAKAGEAGTAREKATAAAAGVDFSNQDPQAAQAVFQKWAQSAEKSDAAQRFSAQGSVAQGQHKPAAQAKTAAQAKKPVKKAAQTASAKKAAQTKKQTAGQPANPAATQPAGYSPYGAPAYSDEGVYVVDYGSPNSGWVELSDGTIMRKSDGTRTFNLPYEKNPYTGEIKPFVEPMSEAAYKMYQSQQAGFQPPTITHYSKPPATPVPRPYNPNFP
ncbi:hypothetical protein KDJ56_17375 [Brevibacillus composti]|uniref:Uncharacterized protein n=1 Tax=Brevibacillus composti TaxID=2796470 RepID=A0A7T5JN21_9BACL|nr:hypothetical protein [Brevibacillus composti]QQE73651.1 hypothetical protein JD108_17430 [Brevibacillus composti]QUO40733.1 hypothetical protein KDJ56_17375 [Brevibacillus composti]